jgi:hypothetical protein
MSRIIEQLLTIAERGALQTLFSNYMSSVHFMYEDDQAYAHPDDAILEYLTAEPMLAQRELADALEKLLVADLEDTQLDDELWRDTSFGYGYRQHHASAKTYLRHVHTIVVPWVRRVRDYAPAVMMQLRVNPRLGHTVDKHVGRDVETFAAGVDPHGTRWLKATSFDDLTTAERWIAAACVASKVSIEANKTALAPNLVASQLLPVLVYQASERVGSYVAFDGRQDASTVAVTLIRDARVNDGVRVFAAYPVPEPSAVINHGFSEEDLEILRGLFGSYFHPYWIDYTPFGWRQAVADYARSRTHAQLRHAEKLVRQVVADVDRPQRDAFLFRTLYCMFEPVSWFLRGDTDSDSERYMTDYDHDIWLTDVADYLARIVSEVPESSQPERLPPFNNRVRAGIGLPRYTA